MSAALTVGAVGTAFSIYSGIQGGKQANAEKAQSQQALQQNQQIANEMKADEAPAEAAVNQKVGELSSKNMTPGALMAEGQLKQQMSDSQKQITANASMTGEGVAGSRGLSTQFAQAQGIAGINLQDQVNKNAQLGGWIDKATAEPAWARVATGANKDVASQDAQWSRQDQAGSQSAYGAAAAGLSNLAKLYNAPGTGQATDYDAPSAPTGSGPQSGAAPALSQDDSTALQNMQMNPQQQPAPQYAGYPPFGR